MAPERGGKRKRGAYSGDDGSRPSPYRPGNTGLAQHGYNGPPHGGYQDNRGRNTRRGGGGGGVGGGRGRGGPRNQESPNGFNQRPQSNLQTSRPPSQQSQANNEPVVAQEAPSTPQTPAVPIQPAALVDPYTAAAAMKFSEPEMAPAYYSYDILTDDVAQTWENGGRSALLDSATQMRKHHNDDELGILWQELLRAGLDGKVPPADVGAFVKDVLAVEAQTEEPEETSYGSAASDLLDLVCMLNEDDKTNPRLAAILFASEIPHEKMRTELDSDVLVALNLVRSTFGKAFIRHQTNMLYRQSNYNLLREETEGYSKLLTELFTTSANEPPSAENVKATWERVRSMIGTFDLDVGRVLDVTLDVFAAVLIREYRFFVKFLRCSSWWPSDTATNSWEFKLPHWALPDAHGMETLSEEAKSSLAESRRIRDEKFWRLARELASKGEGIQAFLQLHTLHSDRSGDDPSAKPAGGSKVAAQILGFKLRFYSSKARDAQDELPNNLIHLAALLIKIGFISIQDIYPHLWPADEAMEHVKTQKRAEDVERKQAARPGGGRNALAMAGALPDDMAPVSRSRPVDPKAVAKIDAGLEPEAKKEEEELPEPKDTKIALLRALLAIGAIPEALFILGRFPWLMELIPDLPEHVHRLLNHSISILAVPLTPLQNVPELSEPANVADPDQSGVSKGALKLIRQAAPKILRWPNLDRYIPDENTQYRYYWEDWNDSMPVCQTVDDLFTLCDTFVNLIGVKVGRDPVLITKLYRIGINSLETDSSEANTHRWINLCKKLLVPALSLLGHNSPVVSEAYDMLKRFSQATRYSIYSEWYLGATSRLDDMSDAFATSIAETKDILKKISKTNVKPMARALAKAATSSPGIVFRIAIAQMESYSNLVEVVVECARYFTSLGFDILTWSTLSALAKERNRESADGMFASKWLTALSSFFGRVYWRYGMMNLNPTLQYLNHQLWRGNPKDLKVFEDLLLNMGGIRSDITLNDAQIVAMAGGSIIQKELLLSLQDNRHLSKGTGRRLMRSLIESKLVGPFVVGIAHERQTQLFKLGADGAPLKLLGNAFDEMHRILNQYLEFLREYLNCEDFDRWVPALHGLIGNYGLEPRIAFWICRASIVSKMEDWDKTQVEERTKALEIKAAESSNGEDVTTNTAGSADVQMVDAPTAEQPSSDHAEASLVGWHPVLKEIMDQSRNAIGAENLETIGEMFYMTFWQLSHGDLYVPQESYKAEETRISQKLKAISADRSDQTLAGSRKRTADRESCEALKMALSSELKEQVSSYGRFTRVRIAREKEHWFAHTWRKHDALNGALLEQCFIPRMVLSQVDAYYCFRMLKLLHSNGAKNFRTMGFLNQFFNQKSLATYIYMCTLKEAENLAVFINEVLKDLSRWHAKKETYEAEAWGARKDLPGFCLKLGDDKAGHVFLSYDDGFRRLLFKWHGQLANAIRQCLEGNEYMHIRNAITVLRGIVAIFPVIDIQAKKLLETVSKLGKNEERADLKLAAQSLLGALSRRERNNEWVRAASFYDAKPTSAGSPPVSTATPGPGTSKILNPAAPDFAPVRPNGVGRTVAEYEDGEINSPTVAEAPKSAPAKELPAKHDQPPSTLAHTIPSASTTGGPGAPGGPFASISRTDGSTQAVSSRGDIQGEARPSPAPPGPQSRADSGRLPNGASRPAHNLPTRLEHAAPIGRRSDRGPPRSDERGYRDPRRDEREPAYYETSRGPRSSDPRSRMSDRPHDRAPERPNGPERDRMEPGRRGEAPISRHQTPDERAPRSSARLDRSREPREHGRDATEDLSRDRPAPEATMPPPAPAINPERAARIIQAEPVATGRDERPPRESSRSGSQRNSRTSSPTRRDDRDHRLSHRDERAYPPDPRGERPHLEDRRSAGVRGDPFIGHDDRARAHARQVPPSESYGPRHQRDYGAPPGESQYGRLNGPDTPTGPRGTASAPLARPPMRAPAGPAAASPAAAPDRPVDRPAPSGPASSRAPPRVSTAPRTGSGSAPSTPVTESPTSGLHPERARMFQAGTQSSGPASPSTTPRGPSAGAPTGPTRQMVGTPQSGPPTPAYDRPRGDKRFANLNNTLQQSGGPQGRSDQGTTIRGRGGRNLPQSPLGPGPTPPGGPSGPVRQDGAPGRGEPAHTSRSDLFAGHDGSARRPATEANEQRPRGPGRSPSPPRRGPPQQTGEAPDMRPPPRRMDSRGELRSRNDGPPPPPGPAMPDRERRGPREDYGSGRTSGRHGGGGERRDVRDVQWGGERPPDRRADGPIPPEGPGSGQKRRGEHDEYSRDPKRSRRGHRN